MFNFFKKKKIVEERMLGTFTAYDIEYVYEFLGKEKIENRIAELQRVATMGKPFKEFVETLCNFGNRGALFVFDLILGYFENDLQLAIFLFEKSKNYREDNYHDGPNTKIGFERHLASINNIIERKKEISAHLQDKLQSNYWIDFHFFYLILIKLFIRALSRKHEKRQLIEGTYYRNGKKYEGNIFSFKINTKKDEDNSKYMVMLNPGESFGKAYTLYPDNEGIGTYRISDYYFQYSLLIEGEFIKIERRHPINIELNKLIETTDFDKIIIELVELYLPNTYKISKRFLDQPYHDSPFSNSVLYDAADYYRFNFPMLKSIIEINNQYPDVWRKMEIGTFIHKNEEFE